MFKQKFPFYTVLLACITTGISGYYLTFLFTTKKNPTSVYLSAGAVDDKTVDIIRSSNNNNLTHPLLYASTSAYSTAMLQLKGALQNKVNELKNSGRVNSVSIFIKTMDNGETVIINPNETYNPASLIKVPTMIAVLKDAEQHPALLGKQLFYDKEVVAPKQTWEGKSIIPGNTYTVKDLIFSMIAYSDNRAAMLLHNVSSPQLLETTFTDLGLPKPDVHNMMTQITAKDYSVFMNVLYNASYLNASSSEFALQVLTQCSFKDGLVKELPNDVLVAHKFGEGGNMTQHELHESGIVYTSNKNYIITIMTKGGSDVKTLAPVISEISKMVYDAIGKPNISELHKTNRQIAAL